MDSFVAAGDESAERSQHPTGSLILAPILSRIEVELPCLRAAEEALTRAILSSPSLSQPEQCFLLSAAGDEWPAAIRSLATPAVGNLAEDEMNGLARFGRKLARYGPWCCKDDCDELAVAGYAETAIVAATATIALGHFRCSLAAGLLACNSTVDPSTPDRLDEPEWKETTAPFIAPSLDSSEALDRSFASLRALFGFVPSLIQIQSRLPDTVEAEVQLIDGALSTEDHLNQTQKHTISLALAAANCNNYLVALHGEILTLIGMTPQEVVALLDNLESAAIPAPDGTLCIESQKLRVGLPRGKQPFQRAKLAEAGFTGEQIVEGVVTAALANFLSTMQFGLGTLPDFPPLRTFGVKDLYPSSRQSRPSQNEFVRDDPDFEFVSKVKSGETAAFEPLVRSNTRRVFRTLYGMLGNPEEARDATQDTFLKAFQHIDKFEGRSKFSTWLTSIAVNTGTEILRGRRPMESLDIEDEEHGFRPRQVRSWIASPEEALAKSQLNDLVRKGILRLPEKYRTALLLRDINQLSTEDTAEAMGLSLPATKARILRGRLMLRESLAPHFSQAEGDRHV